MKTLYIIGRGIDPSLHLTLEGIQALQSSEVVYGIEPEKNIWFDLKNKYNFPDVTDITHLYQCGSTDKTNYLNFIDFVEEKFNHHKQIALLIAGHPRLGVTFAQIIRKEINDNINIRFISNVSSFDIMINDLALDPLEQGSCLLDANRLLLFNYQLETSLNYFIYHICSVGTQKLNFDDTTRDNNIKYLQDYLLRFYAPTKKIFFCKASNGPQDPGSYQSIELAQFVEHAQKIDFGTSLFIPSENPKSLNREFLNLIRQ